MPELLDGDAAARWLPQLRLNRRMAADRVTAVGRHPLNR